MPKILSEIFQKKGLKFFKKYVKFTMTLSNSRKLAKNFVFHSDITRNDESALSFDVFFSFHFISREPIT